MRVEHVTARDSGERSGFKQGEKRDCLAEKEQDDDTRWM